MTELVVIGAGLVGCAVAREAARDGMRVVVLERGTPGGEASGAAAGMLAPLSGAHDAGPFTDLLLRSRAVYPALANALREETGVDIGYSAVGTLFLSLYESDDTPLEQRWAWQSQGGYAVERLYPEAVREMEPAVGPDVRWALRYPLDHQVDNRLLSRAMWLAAARAGADFRLGAEAVAVVQDGDRVTGVRLAGGEVVRGERVVVAGGCWSGLLAGLPRPLPVEPVRGQIVAIESAPPIFRHVVDSFRCYAVPRVDGRLLIGSTSESVGYRKAVTTAGIRGLIDAAIELSPALSDANVAESWSGLRPSSPDGRPIVGADPELGGLYYATGHYRDGILLGPHTAQLLYAAIRGDPAPELELLSPARFA